MKEVMAKAKLAKYERQKLREADEEMRMELDEELGDIRSLLFQRPEGHDDSAPAPDAKGEEYDAFVREMAFERRAKPQDRLKSAEELAEEQAQRLREAEEARQRRMRGEPEDEDDVPVDEDDKEDAPRIGRSRFGLGEGLDAQASASAVGNTDDVGEDDGDDDDDDGEDDDDSSGDDGAEETEEDADLADYQHLEQIGDAADTQDDEGVAPQRTLHIASDAVPTLPYTFPCPTTHDAFLDLLEEHQVQPTQLNTVIGRIRALHAPNLAEENTVKLQRFLSVLIDHLLFRAGDDVDAHVLNDLLLHIAEMSKTYSLRAAEHFVAKLAIMQRNLMRGLSHGALQPDSMTWPRLSELCFLRAATLLWPMSDRWHAVATPMSLLMAQYLAHARIRSVGDMASTLYLCSLVASAQRESRRLVPEALNALFSVLAVLLPYRTKAGASRSPVKALANKFGLPTPDVETEHTAGLALHADASPAPTMRLSVALAASDDDVQTKADMVHMGVTLVQRFAQLYAPSCAFVELFTPFLFLLEMGVVGVRRVAPSTVVFIDEAASLLRAQLERAIEERQALRLQAHRALSIASYAPKFDQQSFDPKRATDPDTERANAAKMRAMLKKERKGAIRELRKDASFLAEERERRRIAEDASYKRKIDRIVGGMQSERSEEKQLDRARALVKKRAGRK